MTVLGAGQDHVAAGSQCGDGCPCYSIIQAIGTTNDLSRRAFLDGMRQVAAAVTVVTTDGPGGRHGATVSAFASVSADPPTILVCLRSSSRICEAVGRNRLFTVSALNTEHVVVARAFAGEFDASKSDRFADVRLEPFDHLAPGIAGASCFACSTVQMLEQHTHTIVIGHVARITTTRRRPLLYHDAAYRRLETGEPL